MRTASVAFWPFLSSCNQTQYHQIQRSLYYQFRQLPWACRNFFRGEQNTLRGTKFEIHGTGTNEGPENRNRTAKCVNILLYFKFLRSFGLFHRHLLLKTKMISTFSKIFPKYRAGAMISTFSKIFPKSREEQ